MTWHLRAKGRRVNIKRVRRLMRLMGLLPTYQKPRTSIPDKGHKIYPYLLKGMKINRPNQVWCADITYIPLAKGFRYLVCLHGLGEQESVELAFVEHYGRSVLRRSVGRGAGPV